jgi:hypothetical protein
MTTLLARVGGLLYERRPEARLRGVDGALAGVAIAVVSTPADVTVAATVVGLELAARRPRAAVLICLWAGDHDRVGWCAPASRPAAALAGDLSAQGHDANARGPLVLVRLQADEDAAVEQARAAATRAEAAPFVLALGRPRRATFERALGGYDLVVIASRPQDAVVRGLALARRPDAPPSRALELPDSFLPRTLAAGGFRLTRPMKTAVAATLGGIG